MELPDARPIESTDFGPLDSNSPIACKAIAQIQVDEALVWHAGFDGHALEILDHVLGEPYCDGLLQLRSIRVLAGLELNEIEFRFTSLFPLVESALTHESSSR